MGDLKTPDEWALLKRIVILDPDGWRRPGDPPWEQPISELEFTHRAMQSTVSGWDWGVE